MNNKIDGLAKKQKELLTFTDNLQQRWSDEKEYEDFADYIARAKSVIEEYDGTFISLTRSPFLLKFKFGEQEQGIKVTTKQVALLYF